ncbi:MAG: 4Fe-4S dicluster domain-containing protein [Nanoarchaeota archaeon]|nr:4Fe-4S dicluster domain-containing protein [Nanoarchaeota archaeon]
MLQYSLKKSDFNRFVNTIKKNSDFIGPIQGDQTKKVSQSFFKNIDSVEELYLNKKTYYPVKNFFFDNKETIFEFNGNKVIDPKITLRPRVFFGLRRCDLNGIMHQDTVFLEENTDPFYKARRDASILIGLHCKKGDDYCFCNSIELKDFFDLMFYDKCKTYAIEVGSKKGEEFVKKYKNFFKVAENVIKDADRKTENKRSLNTLEIKGYYQNNDWKKGAEACISCGACNFLCPNCHCFDFEDEINFDLKTGKRIRKPASCQLRSFTRVAGDHIFRDARLARFKHRIYHQIQYFKDRHGVVFCTGCGRCIEGCPSRIDWVEIINEMKK